MDRRRFFKSLFGITTLLPVTLVARPHLSPNPPLTLLTSSLAGFQYYSGQYLWPKISRGDGLWLLREPDNPHDKRAVALFWDGYKIGYVPRRDNTVIAQLMDQSLPLECRITEKNESPDPWKRIRFSVYASV